MLPNQMYGSGHGHGHYKYGHKKREKELSKTQSNPALGSVLFESAPLPHVRASVGSAATSMDLMGPGQPRSTDVSVMSVDPQQSTKTRGPEVLVSKPQSLPLWRKGWKASRLLCALPKLHQPSPFRAKSVGETTTSVSTALDFPKDRHGSNLTLHCIDLQAHNEHMKSLLSSIHTRVLEDNTVPSLPSRFLNPASLSSKRVAMDTSGPSRSEVTTVELDQSSAHKLLRKSAAAICAYTGYSDTSSQALDILATVLRDYLTIFTKHLRTNADQALENYGVAFEDVLDQTLHQFGVEGKAGLDQHWQDSVKGFVKYLEEEIRDTTHEYIQIVDPPKNVPVPKKRKNESLAIWPLDPESIPVTGTEEEEASLDSVLENANMENLKTTKPPDLDDSNAFAQLSDQVSQEVGSDEFTSLGLDGPPPFKRLRTMSFGD